MSRTFKTDPTQKPIENVETCFVASSLLQAVLPWFISESMDSKMETQMLSSEVLIKMVMFVVTLLILQPVLFLICTGHNLILTFRKELVLTFVLFGRVL